MEPITLRQLLEAVDGTLLGEFSDLDATFTAVDTDSRNIRSRQSVYPFTGRAVRRPRLSPSSPVGGGGGLPHRPNPGQL